MKGITIDIYGLFGIALVILKLTGVIDWSWWWVALPLWFGLAYLAAIAAFTIVLPVVFLVFGVILVGGEALVDAIGRARKRGDNDKP